MVTKEETGGLSNGAILGIVLGTVAFVCLKIGEGSLLSTSCLLVLDTATNTIPSLLQFSKIRNVHKYDPHCSCVQQPCTVFVGDGV